MSTGKALPAPVVPEPVVPEPVVPESPVPEPVGNAAVEVIRPARKQALNSLPSGNMFADEAEMKI